MNRKNRLGVRNGAFHWRLRGRDDSHRGHAVRRILLAAAVRAETTDILRAPTGEVRAPGVFGVGLLAEARANDDRDTDGDVRPDIA
jgi:hypothetical protein